MMKNFRNIIIVIFTISAFLGIYSCTDDKEYLKFTEGGEISYTAAIDSLEIFSGQNRVKVQGLIIGDPKVTEVRVYWNSNKDSVSVPINRTANIDMVSIIIDGLEENIYNFVVKTFDAKGNSSISVSKTAEVYGDRYIASLFDRPIDGHYTGYNTFTIDYADMDLSLGAIGTEVEYTSKTGELSTIFINTEEPSVTLSDYEIGMDYRYRTVYLPEETVIDTFYTAFKEINPKPLPLLSNAAVPFKAASTDGRWGNLAEPWITNDAAKNHNGYGGWDEWNGNIFNLESGWGAPAITNGKVYQMVTAIPATYQLKVALRDTNHAAADAGGAYFVIGKGGGELPNVENLTTAPEVLAYKRIVSTSSLNYVVEFTVDQTTNISVGLLTTQTGGNPGRYANIKSWEIVVVD